MFKKTLVASALAVAALSAQASSIVTIDPDGTAAANGSIAVAGLDWNAGTVLVTPTGVNLAGGTASTNAASPNIGDVVQSYAQASLSVFNANTGAIAVNGLNVAGTGFEWTFVAGFQEVISNFAGGVGIGTIQLDTVAGGENFFRVYAGAVDSNNLAGTGYNNGKVILSGSVLTYNPTTGSGRTTFTTTGDNSNALDKFVTDNYSGIKTVNGSGSATLDLLVTAWDSDYFQGLTTDTIMSLTFDTQVGTPFRNSNPSAKVTKADNTLIDATTLASVGAINGVTGPNFVLQSDGTSAFNVPEPASLALASFALLGLGASRRRAAK